jgi:hypothetical protein
MQDMESHLWVELIEPVDHHVDIGVLCACAVYRVAKPTYMIDRLGRDATIGDALRRLYCRACGERLTLNFSFEWGYGPLRDHRVDPPPLPDWFEPHVTFGPRAEQLREAFDRVVGES